MLSLRGQAYPILCSSNKSIFNEERIKTILYYSMFITFPKHQRLGGPQRLSEGFGEKKIGYLWPESNPS